MSEKPANRGVHSSTYRSLLKNLYPLHLIPLLETTHHKVKMLKINLKISRKYLGVCIRFSLPKKS